MHESESQKEGQYIYHFNSTMWRKLHVNPNLLTDIAVALYSRQIEQIIRIGITQCAKSPVVFGRLVAVL